MTERVKITFHETYTPGARSWSADYLGYRADIIRISFDRGSGFGTYRIFVYDENGKQIANPDDVDGNLFDAAAEARRILRKLRDPLDDDPDAEDARQTAYWNAEAERQRPPGE